MKNVILSLGLLVSVTPVFASVNNASCFIKREQNLTWYNGTEVLSTDKDLRLGDDRYETVSYFEIVNQGSVPYLKMAHNHLAKGTLTVDPATHQLHYAFAPLFHKLGSQQQPPQHVGPIYNDEADQRDFVEVTVDPAHPENDMIHVRSERRHATYFADGGVELHAGKWKKGDEVSRPLVGCELHDQNEASKRPPFCETIDAAQAPLGAQCTTTANATVYEKISIDGAHIAWKDQQGLAWSDLIGAYATRAEAVKACADIGAELPSVLDLNAGMTNDFEEAIRFSDHLPGEKKVYWVGSKIHNTYNNKDYDAVFMAVRTPMQPHSELAYSLDDHGFDLETYLETEDDVFVTNVPKPYGALCVWRNRY